MDTDNKGRAHTIYEQLAVRRLPFLQRARLCSRYTIPGLEPPEGTIGSTELYKPFQSIGARGVNNLGSRFLLTLLAPTRRFFRLLLADDIKKKIPEDQMSDWELALSAVEEKITRRIETLGLRAHTFELMRHLIVAGNVLLHLSKEGSRVFRLSQYVVRRNAQGEQVEIVIKETISPDEVPDSVYEQVRVKVNSTERTVDMYTHVYLEGRTWKIYQEIKGVTVPESRGTYPKDKCPWLALRWNRDDSEDYSRSHCDDYIGDLIAAESLSRSIIRASAVAAKVVFLVNPNGLTDPSDLESAEEGGFVDGTAEDVTALGLEKFYDFQVAQKTLDDITRRLSYAFLLNSAIQREGERVTAEEIRYMAQELETAVGGSYTVLGIEFQLPLIRIIMGVMQRERSLPALPDKSIEPTIITGIDALGRSHELASLDAFMGGALQTWGPQVMQYVVMSEYLKRRAAGLDLNPKGLIKTPAEIQAEQQAAQQQALAEQATPNLVKAATDHYLANSQRPQPTAKPQPAGAVNA